MRTCRVHAVVRIARNKPKKALEDLAAAIKDEGAAEQYFHQACAYEMIGSKEDAADAVAQALKRGLNPKGLDPSEVDVYNRLKNKP